MPRLSVRCRVEGWCRIAGENNKWATSDPQNWCTDCWNQMEWMHPTLQSQTLRASDALLHHYSLSTSAPPWSTFEMLGSLLKKAFSYPWRKKIQISRESEAHGCLPPNWNGACQFASRFACQVAVQVACLDAGHVQSSYKSRSIQGDGSRVPQPTCSWNPDGEPGDGTIVKEKYRSWSREGNEFRNLELQ